MKKLLCFALIVFLMIPKSVSAEEALTLHLEGYQSQINSISINFNTNFKQEVTSSQLRVMLGGEELPIMEIKTVEAAAQGMTYLFLVDISGSIKDDKQTNMKDILQGIANQLGEKDNAAIMMVGNDNIMSDFVEGKDKILEQIDLIQVSSQDTNLYASIINALGILNTNQSVQTKKCLVVLSDGKDDYTTGYTLEEVNTKIEESNIPIHTVALLNQDASDDLVESAKVLGSFARLSEGGLDITFGLDQMVAKDVSDNIVKSMKQGYVLTADTSAVKISEQSYLEVTIEAEGKAIASAIATDGYSIDTSKLQIQMSPTPKAEEPTATVAPSEQPSPTEPATIEKKNDTTNTYIWLIAGIAGAIVLILVIIIIVAKSRKKHVAIEPISETQPNVQQNMQQNMQQNVNNVMDSHTVAPQPKEQLKIRFIKVGLIEGQIYNVMIEKELIIGRSTVYAQFAFEKDELLSSQHCKITYKDKQLFIEDLGSTNGTFVNGVPVTQKHLLEKDDVILIGSMELRIDW